MKKYLLVVFCVVLLFAITGCGKKNQLKCTGSMNEEGMNIKAEVIADFDDADKLTGATMIYDLGSSETASQWCSMFKYMEDADKGVTVDCSGSKITIKGYGSTAILDEDDVIVGKTKDEFKKLMEEEKITCK